MSPISTSLNEIQITASRPIYSADGEKTLYNVDDDPSVQTGSASDALQNAPGVEVNAEGKISFRGGSNVEVWINDKPSHMDAESLKQYLKMMPAGNIKRIEVISNPSARYKTKGSIINIVTNQQVTHNRMLSAGINASTSPMLSPWISYVWSDDRQSLNFYADIELEREISETNLTSQILTPDSVVSNHYDYVGQQFENGRQAFVGAEYTLEIDTLTDLSAWLEIYPRLAAGHSSIDAHRTEYIYTYGVEFPTVGKDGGGNEVFDLYGIMACPTLVLIMPDRSIPIQGLLDLYPFSAQDVVNAMQQNGLQPHDCTGTLTVNPQTLQIYNDGETYQPGRLTISNMTAEDVTVNAFTADPIFALQCMYEGQEVTEGMTVAAGQTATVEVYVDMPMKENFEGKMYVNTSAGNFEVDIVYEMTVGVDENSTTLTMFPNPANESVTLQGENNRLLEVVV